MSAELTLLSLADLSRHIREGHVSSVEVTRSYFDRIEMLDGRLHSFNTLRTEAALAEAQAADRETALGNWRGPLHGVPIGIKDMIDVAGVPTTAQAVHRRDAIADEDADVVAALKGAGAVILGKQAMSEYAVGGTQLNHAWPPACNPWNLDLDTLSSSSGPAVAVAAGLCAGSVGTETAGSIRAPAAWCGVAGLKPTNGLVSTKGVLPLSPSMDCVGPIAWTVEDCALLLSGMVSADAEPNGLRLPIVGDGIKGMRVGVVRHFYENDPDVDDAVLAATANAIDVLQDLGATCTDVRLGDFNELCDIARAISWPEEYAAHRAELEAYPDRLTEVSRSRLQDGKAYSTEQYRAARQKRVEVIADFNQLMRDVDVLVLPTLKKAAQILGFEFTELGAVDIDMTRPFNLTDGPALAMCHGYDGEGLPLSLQIIGRHFEDDVVLRVGHSLEKTLGLRDRRPRIALT
ncbi:amidase [Roseibium marinum]|uniref:Aspartyl-tRNA(Asn)/glutamyl-tRNA(Gln) amidotransferase subunit A n=1 Tax=Roseibium marinum TaxID=281252 RepID=A0A2S3UN29_9HYPH|nr:amidase [Roseibium marinum]POF29105.1 aspartyl-tRNA(Asn)/glutamyl-tRNA(Gln) amidotransferase subunit A [Roseibium marinum]